MSVLKVIIEPAKKYQKTNNSNIWITLSGEQHIHRINKQPAGLKTFVFLDGIGRLDIDDYSDSNYSASVTDSMIVTSVSSWMYENGINA